LSCPPRVGHGGWLASVSHADRVATAGR